MLIGNRYFSVFRTSARGLEAQRIAMGAASENIANASTTRTADGTPYALKRAVHEVPEENYTQFAQLLSDLQNGVQTTQGSHLSGTSLKRQLPNLELGPVTEVQAEARFRTEYDPTHPHANAEGYVQYPDINVVEEMTRMISANRVYEANLSAVQAAKEMIKRTMEI